MDRQLLERMIGAGVLIVALVLIAPAILDGRRDAGIAAYSSGRAGDAKAPVGLPESSQRPPEMRTHTIVLDREPDRPPVARPVTEPNPPEAARPEKTTAAAIKAPERSQEPERRQTPEKPVKSAKAVSPPVTAPPGPGWSVQLGSFGERPNAEKLASEVKSAGFTAYLEPLNQSGRTFYRVRVGPRDTRDQATKLAGGLAKAGYSGQVIQQQSTP